MAHDYSISIYLDTRRAKANNLYPVKLRVFTSTPRKQKLYQTKIDLTEKEFNSAWNTSKPRGEHKTLRKQLQALESKANDIGDSLRPFTFDQFEKRLYRNAGDGINVSYHYKQIIKDYTKRGQIGTASSYDLSSKSLTDFAKTAKNQQFEKLTLYDISPDWLKDFEYFMVEVKGRSITTVGIYLRALRAIFNKAIDEKEIDRDYYPFGKRKYQIPATRNVKKALSKDQLSVLYKSTPQNSHQQKAKDFWFFSYSCNGMNIKDIALLKYSDIKDDKIEFYRAKTKLTSKANLKPITVYLNDFTKDIIERYGNKEIIPNNYVFNVLTKGLDPMKQKTKIQAFTRSINQHIKKLCIANDLPKEISTYWARHSFATNAVRNGASLEFIQESLGHSDLKTTQGYFAGFDSATKKDFAEQLMNL